MTFGQFGSILRARWGVVALVFALVVGTSVAVSLLLPKSYSATSSVVVDATPDPVSAMLYGGLASTAFIATQVDVIGSDRVAYRVVRNLKLTDNPQIREGWLADTNGEGTIEQWLSTVFQKSMTVQPSRESNVISIVYKAADPRFAAALANAFAEAYVQTSVELRVNPAKQYSAFFDTRAKEARTALELAQGKLSDYQRTNGIIATDERLDVETARLSDLSSQLVGIQAVSSESGSRLAQARGDSADKMQEVLNNGVVSALKADISRGEARIQELNARLGENNPQVIEAKANVNELRSRMEAEIRRVTGGVGISASINRQREAEVRASLEAQRTKLLKLKAVRDQGAVLARDVDSAQRAYDAVVGRLNQTSLEGQTTQSNVSILTPAVAPIRPSFPNVTLNIALSVVVGLLLAIVCAMAREVFDRRVRAVEDVTTVLGLPVFGILPGPDAKRMLGINRASLMQRRLIPQISPNRGRT